MPKQARYAKLVKQISDAGDLTRTGAIMINDGEAAIYFLWGQPSHAYVRVGDLTVEGDAALKTIAFQSSQPGKVSWSANTVLQKETLHCSTQELRETIETLSTAGSDNPASVPVAEGRSQGYRGWDGDERRASALLTYDLSDFPLLPTGTPLWAEVPANVVHLDVLLSALPTVLVVVDGPDARGAAIARNGSFVDGLFIDPGGLKIGEEAGAALLTVEGGMVSAFEIDERLADALPHLWRSRVMYRDLDKRWFDGYGLLDALQHDGEDRAVIIATPDDVGVVLFTHGQIAGAYTALSPQPSVALHEVLALFHDPNGGSVSVLERADDVAPVAGRRGFTRRASDGVGDQAPRDETVPAATEEPAATAAFPAEGSWVPQSDGSLPPYLRFDPTAPPESVAAPEAPMDPPAVVNAPVPPAPVVPLDPTPSLDAAPEAPFVPRIVEEPSAAPPDAFMWDASPQEPASPSGTPQAPNDGVPVSTDDGASATPPTPFVDEGAPAPTDSPAQVDEQVVGQPMAPTWGQTDASSSPPSEEPMFTSFLDTPPAPAAPSPPSAGPPPQEEVPPAPAPAADAAGGPTWDMFADFAPAGAPTVPLPPPPTVPPALPSDMPAPSPTPPHEDSSDMSERSAAPQQSWAPTPPQAPPQQWSETPPASMGPQGSGPAVADLSQVVVHLIEMSDAALGSQGRPLRRELEHAEQTPNALRDIIFQMRRGDIAGLTGPVVESLAGQMLAYVADECSAL